MKKSSVKIIGGNFKRKNILFSEVDGLRPTLGRIRETLFNWLGQDLNHHICLDLFAGSGALSFEALSRSAKFCQLIEANNEAYRNLVINKESLGFTNCDIQLNTAENYLKRNMDQFDIIFFDPPFGSPEFSLLIPSLKHHLNEEGLIYYESSRPYDDVDFKIIKESRAGQVYFYLLKK